MPNYENILFKTKESLLRDVHHEILSVKGCHIFDRETSFWIIWFIYKQKTSPRDREEVLSKPILSFILQQI